MATVAGIELRIHVTFLLLVGLVALGSSGPGGPGAVAGLLWLVALFACVVVHELAHGLVARRNGIPVSEIELLPIGGVSKMERVPEDPRVELRIAAAGPAASVALGAALLGVALVLGVPLWPPSVAGSGFLVRLGWVNLLLAGFNLVPAFPLDGGRVLRAALEQRTDRQRATAVAARLGRLFASAMIVAGIAFNVWLLFIGVFVYFGSWAEEEATRIHDRIKGLRVQDVMIRDPAVVTASAPVAQVTPLLSRTAQREFPVIDDAGHVVGLVTADALLQAGRRATIASVMDAEAPVLAPGDLLEQSELLGGGLQSATVVSAGRVVGLARAADAVRLARAPA